MIADLVVVSLAVFITTKVLFETTGPFDIFSKSRDLMSKKSRNLTVFSTCIWCQTTLFSVLAIPVLIGLGHSIELSLLLWLSTAGLAGMLRFLTINKGGL